MKIEVLGPGCQKCKQLFGEAEKAIAASGLPVEIEKVDNPDEIMKHNVLMTPALVINGEVKSAGRIPPLPEIVSWITTAAAKEMA